MVADAKFKVGDTVADRIHPARKLVIRSYMDRIYYCRPQENRHLKPLVYFERDLMAEAGSGKLQIGS
jgi:hypothetical protein